VLGATPQPKKNSQIVSRKFNSRIAICDSGFDIPFGRQLNFATRRMSDLQQKNMHGTQTFLSADIEYLPKWTLDASSTIWDKLRIVFKMCITNIFF